MKDESSLPDADAVGDRVATALDATVRSVTELDGGLVGRVFRVDFADRAPVAAKVDDSPLENEARMLRWLAAETQLPVPDVYYVESDLLVMEYVEGDGVFDERAERDLADHLAALHDVTADAYGFEFDTLSGPFIQSNPWTDSWIEFFRDQRLRPFARAAHEDGSLTDEGLARIRRLADRLDDLLVEPPSPSLVHGDLHPGNVVVADGAVQAVIDPAIYFGHDELGLAYVQRSPEIGEAFLDQYRQTRSIDAGYFEGRKDVYTVFHVLENVRYFGAEVRPRLDEALDAVGL
ncbi:fructosamine kinase family protein [Natranaeroarchaeum aerophilus]|uniref:Fructosamine kinase family protein n=1 Tax=Natranaeroarchaeum aerophilus TaxID=2917711 RepID=A0AAE3FTI1_9EURY|nr:fructosamine kinase family protein [Natranaeroarchaeum aerophilus]MCL9814745.1 fructosamine kinase family protein [Natranaeroarchaeum aerophilus]